MQRRFRPPPPSTGLVIERGDSQQQDTMERIAQERDRLLTSSARVLGSACTLVSVGAVACTFTVPLLPLVLTLLCIAAMIVALAIVGETASQWWTVVAEAAGLAAMVFVITSGDSSADRVLLSQALIPLACGGIASLALVNRSKKLPAVLHLITAVLTLALVAFGCGTVLALPVVTVAIGWALIALAGWWVSRTMPRMTRRIVSIGNAHQAERQASETEAQRRQSARLLHDTVLATLTLLAHSGVGVSEEAMRQQAAEDARLLRHLRLGSTPQPAQSGDYALAVAEEPALGQTLESVKQRFGRMGLEVSWHGTGQVLLPSHVLDAFVLALAECLENVRRHAGVQEAHVTIVDDPNVVRAIVTDSGVGFNPAEVGAERLGFAESVVNRLREVGGNARLFSAPGSGTTVVLEAPR